MAVSKPTGSVQLGIMRAPFCFIELVGARRNQRGIDLAGSINAVDSGEADQPSVTTASANRLTNVSGVWATSR
jgi:hypothetical protein